MTITAIVVSTKNGGIGMDDRLPWINLDSLKDSYIELAKDNVVIVGKHSFNAHNYLRGAITYVYTSDEAFEETDTVKRITGDAQTVLDTIKSNHPDKDIIVAGGGTIFKSFYDMIDEWRVTFINESVVFNKDIDMTNVQYIWNDRRLLSSGVDNNKDFEVWHFKKSA